MRASALLVGALVAVNLASCATRATNDATTRMTSLKATYDRLHQRLEKATATEPFVAAAFADRGQVMLAIRSGLIEELAGNVARRYLDRVTLDLSEAEGHSSGELGKKTFLGRVKIGDWSLGIDVGELAGELRAGAPRVSLRGPDLIAIELPLDVEEAEGDATLHFAWDSAGLVNVVCKDFEMTRKIRGRVLAQSHVLSGALRLANTGEGLTATPIFPDRRVRLRMDLTAPSWAIVEAALRSQNDFAKCGTLMDPDEGLAQLKALAARGINVRLPKSIFRVVSLPTHLHKSVRVNQRAIGLDVTAESLRIVTATLWTSVSVRVRNAGPDPGR